MASINPMHQFELKNFVKIEAFGHNFSLTNGSIVLGVAVLFALFIGSFLGTHKKLIPTRLQSAVEMMLNTIYGVCYGTLGEKGEKYIPFVFSIFLFILTLNIMGLAPVAFAETSHISITFALAMIMFIVCMLITIFKRGLFGFIKHFIPAGTPWWLAPLMFILEVFSYFVRPVSLAVRLAANMIAGHVMLDVIAFFVVMMGVFGILPFAFLCVLMAFELFVAILQAYIFSVFSCVYIGEACEEGH